MFCCEEFDDGGYGVLGEEFGHAVLEKAGAVLVVVDGEWGVGFEGCLAQAGVLMSAGADELEDGREVWSFACLQFGKHQEAEQDCG